MSRHRPADIAASVHQRLLNKARETGRPFGELLQYYAMERFLYRLWKSRHADKFTLKGALLFPVWEIEFPRATMDIDLLGRIDNSIDVIIPTVRDICGQDTAPDGIVFDRNSVRGERITADAAYEGVRVSFRGNLGTARVFMQLDIGFGDIVVPGITRANFPTILDFPAPRLKVYSKESTIAEKLEAMVRHGRINSRMKDFFDLWFLPQVSGFHGSTLAAAIAATFANRGTDLVSRPVAWSRRFMEDSTKAAQWRGFLRKGRIGNVPQSLAIIVNGVIDFLGPVVDAIIADQGFEGIWKPPGPWVDAR